MSERGCYKGKYNRCNMLTGYAISYMIVVMIIKLTYLSDWKQQRSTESDKSPDKIRNREKMRKTK